MLRLRRALILFLPLCQALRVPSPPQKPVRTCDPKPAKAAISVAAGVLLGGAAFVNHPIPAEAAASPPAMAGKASLSSAKASSSSPAPAPSESLVEKFEESVVSPFLERNPLVDTKVYLDPNDENNRIPISH